MAPLHLLIHFLFLFLFTAAAIAATPAPKHHHPHFQHLNVTEIIASTRIHPSSSSEHHHHHDAIIIPTNNTKIKLKLLHRDSHHHHHHHHHHHDYHHRFSARMQRDSNTVLYLTRRLTPGGNTKLYEPEDLGADVVSGMEQGSGEYFVRIGVGTPPTDQYMVIDSGSDILWVQCQPCRLCYPQSDPVFDPAYSASFAGVSCSSPVCDRLQNTGCHSGRCRYEVQYGDGSYTKGTLALETLTFGGQVTVQNVAIGCGHTNKGLFVGAAGLLGLGGGSMSFIGQMGGQTGGAFSYCLVTRGTGSSTGSLEFGRGSLPEGATWVPLIQNSIAPSFYYIGLSGLGVGAVRVPIPEDLFKLTELGEGGVVMDTGTAVTRLPGAAYAAFRDAFVSQTRNLPRTSSGVSIFDTCYDLSEFVTVRVPTVSFYFSGGAVLTLPARNFLIPVNGWGTFCLAFAPSMSGLSIIGNIQQEGIQISVDGANGFVGFGPNVC